MDVSSDVIETSMSALSSFQRCRKRWRYESILGWVPRSVPTNMEIGTLYHEAIAAGNRVLLPLNAAPEGVGKSLNEFYYNGWLNEAVAAVYSVKVDRNNMPLHLDQGQREGVEDMVRFSFEHFWKAELATWQTIFAIEEPAYIQIGRYLIRNTFDAVVRYYDGKTTVIDAKTTDDPNDGKGWIPLDFQTRSYPLAARGKWGTAMPFKHIFVARDVPPGFGHNPITTATGKARPKATLERMSQVGNYVQVTETDFNDEQLNHFEKKLVNLIVEVEHARITDNYGETPIKMGPFACGGCPYNAPCTFEMDGNGESFQPMLYIQKGSEEWNALSAPSDAIPATS